MDLDELLPEIGAFGPYQKWIYFLLCIPATLPSVFTLFSSIFVSATPRHWCRVPEMEALKGRFSPELLVSISIPQRTNGTLPQPNESWAMRACDNGWVYDTTYYDDTLVTQMDIVCDNAWMVSMAQCAFYIGSVVGNLLFGYIGDRQVERFILHVKLSRLSLSNGSLYRAAHDKKEETHQDQFLPNDELLGPGAFSFHTLSPRTAFTARDGPCHQVKPFAIALDLWSLCCYPPGDSVLAATTGNQFA
ncbi:hypothetical protein MRX96_030897 [Rhipicephalus microplus]